MRILRENTYATYPHCNGYYDGGRRVVLGRADGVEELIGVPLDGADGGDQDEQVLLPASVIAAESGISVEPWSPEEPLRSVPWFDVALEAQTLICVRGDAVFIVELAAAERTPRVAYRPRDDWALDGLSSITADGRTAVIGEARDGEYRGLLLDVADGTAREIVRHPWHANHFHFSPSDESWVGYSHEGPAASLDDRLWGWHADHAPQGRPMVDQRALSDEPGEFVALGHERWSFHDTSVMAVAYGESVAGPRGIYEVHADGRPPRLVSAGDRDWHCGVSRDGSRIIVDTTGPAFAPGRGWADAGTRSSLVLIDVATGERRMMADTGFIAHPYHPHPSFTPDGSAVVLNHVEHGADGRVLRRGAALLRIDR